MGRMSLVNAFLALALLGAGCGLLGAEAFRGSRHLTQACRDVPNTNQCLPMEDVVRDAVKKAKDTELGDLWIGWQECLSTVDEDDCGKDDRCEWDETVCFCQMKELKKNQALCLGIPDPASLQAFSECPALTTEDDCKGDDRCEWMSVFCSAKTQPPVAPEDKPKVCRLLKGSTECALIQDKEKCEATKGRCEWVITEPSDEKPEITCPALIEAQESLSQQTATAVADAPQVVEFCSPTRSEQLNAIFEDKKVYKPIKKAEKSCKGQC